jgi:hypothetical protein
VNVVVGNRLLFLPPTRRYIDRSTGYITHLFRWYPIIRAVRGRVYVLHPGRIMNDQPEVVSLVRVYGCVLCSRGRVITLVAVQGILFRFRNTHAHEIHPFSYGTINTAVPPPVCTVFFFFLFSPAVYNV